jgi:LPXTG-site transpeptidase (sortase) family protein
MTGTRIKLKFKSGSLMKKRGLFGLRIFLTLITTCVLLIPSPIEKVNTVQAEELPAPKLQGDSSPGQIISAGGYFTCGIKADGSIVCWGSNDYGQLEVPSPNAGFLQVSNGEYHSCGLKNNGSVVCWGQNSSGQLNVPGLNQDFTQVSAGFNHTCGRKSDGSITCWGSNTQGESTVPGPNENFTHVSVGNFHTCGRKSDGSAVCWGLNSDGQSTIPAPNDSFTQVSAGGYHTCGLKSNGSVVCWGWNNWGQTTVTAPNSSFTQVSTGFQHTCGRKSTGQVVCWGYSPSYQDLSPGNTGFSQISTGHLHTCGIKADGSFVCWGSNTWGQRNPNLYASFSAGGDHTCAVNFGGTITCWGSNNQGQLNVPTPNTGFIEVSAGGWHTCGRKSNGSLVCWGWNFWGQTTVPDPNNNFKQVSAGATQTCGVKNDGTLICWPQNIFTYVPVTPLSGYSQVSAGDTLTCGVKTNQTVECWGIGAGIGLPSDNTNLIQVSAGETHACAQKLIAGPILCWGSNSSGQTSVPGPNNDFERVSVGSSHSCGLIYSFPNPLSCWGDNTNNKLVVPPSNSGFSWVDAGYEHTCARKYDGRIVCWGSNSNGQTSVPHLSILKIPSNAILPWVTVDSYTTLEEIDLAESSTTGLLSNDMNPYNPAFSAVKDSDPLNGTLTLATNGSFTYAPDLDTCGLDSFNYHVSGTTWNSVSAVVEIDVTCVNDEPSFTASDPPPVIEDAPPQTIAGWATFSPGPNEAAQAVQGYAVTNISNPSLFMVNQTPVVDINGNLTFQPAPNQYGTSTFDVQVQDDGGTANGGDDTSQIQTFTITVDPVNDPPTTSGIADVDILEDAPDTIIDLWSSFEDYEDSDSALSYSVFGNTSPGLFTSALITGSPNRYLELDYAPDQNGSSDITVQAEDTGGLTIDTTFTVNIQPVNDQPDFSAVDPPAVSEDAPLQSIPIWATFDPGAANEGTQGVLAYTVSNISNLGLFSQLPAVSLTGTLTYQPASNQNGSSTFDVQVQDDGGTASGGDDLSPIHTYTIQVNSVNDPPTSPGLGALNIVEDTPGNAMDIWPYFSDTEDSDLQLSFAVQGYTNLSLFNLVYMKDDRYLMMAYLPDQFGTSTVTVRATDTGNLFVDGDLVLTLRPVNDAPSFTPGGNIIVPMNSGAYAALWASSISSGPANESGPTLNFTVSNDNNGLFASQPDLSPTGTLSFIPTSGVTGSAQVSVTLSDNGGTTDGGVDTSPTEIFIITVAPFPTITGVWAEGSPAILPGAVVIERINDILVQFDLPLDNPPGNTDPDDVTNPANYLLVRTGLNGLLETTSCQGGVGGDDLNIAINWIGYTTLGNAAQIFINGGAPLASGEYHLLVCGSTSITAGGIPLAGDGLNAGTDYALDFSVILPNRMPDTGFPPGKTTSLTREDQVTLAAHGTGLTLEIPRLNVSLPITGIPFRENTWDVTWLSHQVGWLEGTAFPTWAGNSVLTAHVVNSSGLQGPFAELDSLRYGDQILIKGWGQSYLYEVRSVNILNADDPSAALGHEDYPWITLITCSGYLPNQEMYSSRIVVKAVQVVIK